MLPIAFSLFHYTNMEDASFLLITGIAPVWDTEWQERVQMAIDDHGKHRTVDEMVHQRIGDYEAFKAYQRTVFDRTETYLAEMDAAEFDRVVVERPFRRSWPPPTAPGSPGPRASPCSTASSAGSTSTACATWVRSSWPGASWALEA